MEQASITMATLDRLAETHEKQVSVSVTDGSATVPTTTKLKYLVIYFAFNLGLTLFNKAVMIKVCPEAFYNDLRGQMSLSLQVCVTAFWFLDSPTPQPLF